MRADARKERQGADEALQLARQVDEIYVAKGKKAVHVDLKKNKPANERLLAVMLGPTGNLRAPTIRRGRTLLVGFDPETYKRVLGG